METIKFSQYPELFNSNLKMKDTKRIIRNKTGTKEENQRFHIYFDFLNFLTNMKTNIHFWIN